MSATDTPLNEPFGQVSLSEIAKFLIKHHKIHEGLYDLAVEFNITIGAMGVSKETSLPGVMSQVGRIGLVRTDEKKINTVDASECNPKKTRK